MERRTEAKATVIAVDIHQRHERRAFVQIARCWWLMANGRAKHLGLSTEQHQQSVWRVDFYPQVQIKATVRQTHFHKRWQI